MILKFGALARLFVVLFVSVFCGAFADATIADWREQNFSNRENTGNGADLADPDLDRVLNLCEYSLNMDPQKPDKKWGTVLLEGNNIAVTYIRRKAALGEVVFEPLISNSAAGPWTVPAFTETIQSDDGTLQTIKLSVAQTLGRLVKLQVRRTLTVPQVPSQFTAVNTSGHVDLSWVDNSSNESGFKIERRVGGGSFAPLLTVSAGSTSYVDQGLTEGVVYTYRVCATNDVGDSAFSSEAQITFTSIPPAVPTNFAATAPLQTRVVLTWTDASNNENNFRIERRISGGTFAPFVTLPAGTTTYQDDTVSSGFTYIYRICASNAAGDSVWSADARIAPPAVIANVPTNAVATASGPSQVVLTWSDNSNNESAFKVERRVSGGSFSPLVTLAANTTTYTDNSVIGGVTYIYHVCASNSAGDSAFTDEARVTTPDGTVAPTLTINTPTSRIVYQRNNSNQAYVQIIGTYVGNASRVEARLVARAAGQGTTTNWATIDNAPANGAFHGKLLGTGGWYQLEVRGYAGALAGNIATLDRVGIGEVFVVVGHSVAHAGVNLEGASDDRVSCVPYVNNSPENVSYKSTGDMAYLPSTFAQFGTNSACAPFGGNTYFWAKTGQHLVERLNVPILMFNAAFGGTSIEHWYKASQGIQFEHGFVRSNIRMPYINLYNVLKKYAPMTGIRGVLADQGQNDAGRIATVGENQVFSEYQIWVNQARTDLGHNSLPIVVNRQTPALGTSGAVPGIRNVQQRMVDTHPACFAGPDYDRFGTSVDYRYDGIHLATAGAYLAAEWWADAITTTNFLSNSVPWQPTF